MSDRENPDEFCLGLLAKPNHREALSWLEGSAGKHTLGELPDTQRSIALVREAYSAGAAEVIAVEIDEYPHMGNTQNTGKLVVKLPDEPSKRRQVLRWTGRVAEAQGFDADAEMGQKYVFVMLD